MALLAAYRIPFLYTVPETLKKNKPISLFSHLQMAFSRFSKWVREAPLHSLPQVEYHWISGPNQASFCTWSIFGWAKFWLWSHREINKVIFKPSRSGAEESRDTMSAGYLGIFPRIIQWVSGAGPCDALSKDYHFPTTAPSTGSTNKHSPLGIEEKEPRKHHWSFSV